MGESAPPATWVLLAIALGVLAVNIAILRSRLLKAVAVSGLILAAAVHSAFAYAHLSRVLISHERPNSPELEAVLPRDPVLRSEYQGRRVAELFVALFGSLSAGIVFAAIPADVFTRRRGNTSASKA